MSKPVIFCDCYGVIIDEIAPVWMERFFPPEEAAAKKKMVFDRSDIGLLSEDETYEELSVITGVAPEQIRSDYYDMVNVNHELVAFLRELRKDYNVYLLSNAVASQLRRIMSENDLYSAFDRVFISSEMKLIKPDPEFFNHVIRELNVDPSMTVMIDDNPNNVRSAMSVGLSGIVFHDNKQFFGELSRFLKDRTQK